jgi:hypothetical protein
MRRYCARGLAASVLFIATIGCHDSLVNPLPVSAAQTQAEPAKSTSSKAEIVVTKEKLAGYVVATDADTLTFESDGDVSYSVFFPKKNPKDPTKFPPACDPTKTDVTVKHQVTPLASFTCAINRPTKSGGKIYYKLGKPQSPPPSPAPAPGPPPPPPPPPTEIPFSVVHCNHC